MPVPLPGMRHWTVRCVPRTCGTGATQEVDVHAALLTAGGVLLAPLVVAYTFRNAGNRN